MPKQPALRQRHSENIGEEADEQLVDLARRGDQHALSGLLARYRQRAVRAAYGMLHSAEDAEDVAQEAFIRVFRSLPAYQGRGKFFTWLYRIIVNLCASRRRTPSAREVATGDIETCERSETVEESTVRSAAVWAVLGRLPHQQRAALILREMEQLPYADIAEVMEIAEGTVKYHISEARRNFRRMWLEETSNEM